MSRPNYEILNSLPEMSDADFLVCELTSVYLSYMKTSPEIAVITNLWPEHLEWHGSMQAYVRAKQTILRHQESDDWAILNSDDQLVREHFGPLCRGNVAHFGLKDPGQPHCVFVADGSIRARWDGAERAITPADRLGAEYAFIGNSLAAIAAALAAGIETPALGRALETFPGVHLRREFVGEVEGVRVINDGMAGSPVKVRVGLETFTDRSVILIAGGRATFPTRSPAQFLGGRSATRGSGQGHRDEDSGRYPLRRRRRHTPSTPDQAGLCGGSPGRCPGFF